ncbi:MAG: TetR/AcrR family transcriptional regulator [Telmatospirillum sp.]|nr:TetR/AcrR family transcriptional regulator [Telmatospirillum sp.]
MRERIMTPSPRRRASIGSRRNPETESAVLDAARELLADKGYAGFSIEEVARRAGAGKPTIYRWWPTKADLFVALYGREKTAAIPVPDLGNLAADLARYTLDLWAFWRTNPAGGAFRGLVAEAQGNEAALSLLRDRFLPERLEPLRILFARGVDRDGLAPAEVPARLSLWIGFNWFRVLTGQVEDDGTVAATMRIIAGDRS